MLAMDKDKTIQELNKLNIELARQLDEKNSFIQENNNFFAHDLRIKCIRDLALVKGYSLTEQLSDKEAKLQLSKSFGNPKAIEENKEHEFARKHSLVHMKSNSICTWIPKNACSTLRYSIALSNGAISGIEEIDWIHKNNLSFTASNKELLDAKYTFTILRNPFKRLLSFYCDKICNSGKNSNDSSYETAQTTLKTDLSTSFEDFINILWQDPAMKRRNKHIQDQCDFLVYKNYHDYLAFEEFKQTASTIFEKSGITLEDTRSYNSIYTTHGCTFSDELKFDTPAESIGLAAMSSKKPKVENMYNDDLIKKVGSLYLSDILLYLKVIKNAKDEMRDWLRYMC